MPNIGFSTGALAKSDFGLALTLLEKTTASAVELSALRAGELPALLDALPSLLGHLMERYQYVGFHAPTNFEDEAELIQQLVFVAHLGLNVVVHPDTIQNVNAWRTLGSRLCLENLDSRRSTGRTSDELASFFEELPQAKLCFDIAHARQVDPTMMEAARILVRFRDRLAQVHISEINSRGRHFAVSYAAKLTFRPFADILSKVPVIIESIVDEEQIAEEICSVEEVFKPLRNSLTSEVASECVEVASRI